MSQIFLFSYFLWLLDKIVLSGFHGHKKAAFISTEGIVWLINLQHTSNIFLSSTLFSNKKFETSKGPRLVLKSDLLCVYVTLNPSRNLTGFKSTTIRLWPVWARAQFLTRSWSCRTLSDDWALKMVISNQRHLRIS